MLEVGAVGRVGHCRGLILLVHKHLLEGLRLLVLLIQVRECQPTHLLLDLMVAVILLLLGWGHHLVCIFNSLVIMVVVVFREGHGLADWVLISFEHGLLAFFKVCLQVPAHDRVVRRPVLLV